jgi:hypothetical protein
MNPISQPGWDNASRAVPDWRSLLRAASTEEEIISAARDYVATWSPEEVARLPAECRPGRIRDGEDIGRWAFDLATAHCATTVGGEEEDLLTKMLVFVTHAAGRLAEIKAANASDMEALD